MSQKHKSPYILKRMPFHDIFIGQQLLPMNNREDIQQSPPYHTGIKIGKTRYRRKSEGSSVIIDNVPPQRLFWILWNKNKKWPGIAC